MISSKLDNLCLRCGYFNHYCSKTYTCNIKGQCVGIDVSVMDKTYMLHEARNIECIPKYDVIGYIISNEEYITDMMDDANAYHRIRDVWLSEKDYFSIDDVNYIMEKCAFKNEVCDG